LILKPRRKWFAHVCCDAEDGWSGPHNSIDSALRVELLNCESDSYTAYVAQGRKLTKREREEMGVDYSWEVDTKNAMEVRLQNPQQGRLI
jgi:hypothetical protein